MNRVAEYQITFYLKVSVSKDEEPPADNAVEEAVTMLVNEELAGHREGQTRCGLSFSDAHSFDVKEVRRG